MGQLRMGVPPDPSYPVLIWSCAKLTSLGRGLWVHLSPAFYYLMVPWSVDKTLHIAIGTRRARAHRAGVSGRETREHRRTKRTKVHFVLFFKIFYLLLYVSYTGYCDISINTFIMPQFDSSPYYSPSYLIPLFKVASTGFTVLHIHSCIESTSPIFTFFTSFFYPPLPLA